MSPALAGGFFTTTATWEAPYGMQQRNSISEMHSYKCLPQETNKKTTSHKQLKFTPKETRKNIKLKVSRSNKITKITVEK